MESLNDSEDSEDQVETVTKNPSFKGSLIKLDQENDTLLYLEFTKAVDQDQKTKEYSQHQINDIINSIQMQVMKNRSKKTLYSELKKEMQMQTRSAGEMA